MHPLMASHDEVLDGLVLRAGILEVGVHTQSIQNGICVHVRHVHLIGNLHVGPYVFSPCSIASECMEILFRRIECCTHDPRFHALPMELKLEASNISLIGLGARWGAGSGSSIRAMWAALIWSSRVKDGTIRGRPLPLLAAGRDGLRWPEYRLTSPMVRQAYGLFISMVGSFA